MMARAWIHDRMKEAAYQRKVADAKKAKRLPPMRWQVRWPDPDNPGKTRSELRRTVPEAEALRDKIAADLESGIYRDPNAAKEKVRVVAEEWFTAKRPNWKPKTRSHYRDILEGYVLPKWGNTAVGAVSYEGVATWLSGIHNAPGLQGSSKRLVGAGRVQSIYQVMLGVMTWAVKSRRIFANPIAALDTLPSKPPPRRRYLDHKEIAALAAAVAGLKTKTGRPLAGCEMYEVMVLVMAYCGLRIGEVCALRRGSVDLTRRGHDFAVAPQLHVVEAINEGEDGTPEIGLPKGDKLRVVGIPPFLVAPLRIVMSGLDDDDLLFTSPRGEMINVPNWRERVWRPARKEAKLGDDVTPHTLRHSFASLSVAAGADVKTLQEAMGHSSPSITLDVYTDLFPARVAEVASALGNARELALAA
jgi:integrase